MGPRRRLGRSKIAGASDLPDVAPSQTPVPGVANLAPATHETAAGLSGLHSRVTTKWLRLRLTMNKD
jgi:hypothetical protein